LILLPSVFYKYIYNRLILFGIHSEGDFMKRTQLLLIAITSILYSISLFAVELKITPVQTLIEEEITDPRFETVLPSIDLLITPVYTDDEYALSTTSFERLNTGKIIINNPLKVDAIYGNTYQGACEEFGSCWEFTDDKDKTVYDHEGFKDNRSNWEEILTKIQKNTLSRKIFMDKLYGETGIEKNDDLFKYISINISKKHENNYSIDVKQNSGKSVNYFTDPNSIRLDEINRKKVLICAVNNICTDSIKINSINAEEVYIFNYGCNIEIKHIHATKKCRIYNFYGNIELGDRFAPDKINTDISVQLLAEDGSFGFKEIDGDTAINNKEFQNILYKWNNEDYDVFEEDGVLKQLSKLPLMKTSKELFTLKLDLSENWFNFPAGAEYQSTLFFTVESITN